jgi:hypothetical protein
MKRFSAFLAVTVLVLGMVAQSAWAVAQVPKSSVWFDPATAQSGEEIQLNALVYNNQTTDATVTVVFSTSAGTVGTSTATIAQSTAKTVSVAWKMPQENTVVTATVSTAVSSGKKALPGLVGVLGTVSVGSASPGSTVLGLSFPGSKQIASWFGPLITKIEHWRIGQQGHFISLQASTQKKVGDTSMDAKTLSSKILAHPGSYAVLLYAMAGTSVFSSQALFYILAVLLFLLLLRFIVNRFT